MTNTAPKLVIEKTQLQISRRKLVSDFAALSCGALVSPWTLAQTSDPVIGGFGKSSTAEEVTAGIDLKGKTALVTGANSGLGFETMRVLALRGAHVIAVARTMEKAQKACENVKGITTAVGCELSDFDSIVACSDLIRKIGSPIDIFVANAGIMELPTLQQVRGLEKQFVVNYLGHFLLLQRLLDRIKAAEQGRIVLLSSGRYRWAPEEGIQFDNLSGARDYDPLVAYGQSKLAMSLLAEELSRRLQGSTTTANSVMPGVIMTNLGRHLPQWKITAANLFGWMFMKSVEEGAATSCYVSTSPALAAVSGHLFKDCNPVVPEGSHLRNPALAAQLWDTSMALTKAYL